MVRTTTVCVVAAGMLGSASAFLPAMPVTTAVRSQTQCTMAAEGPRVSAAVGAVLAGLVVAGATPVPFVQQTATPPAAYAGGFKENIPILKSYFSGGNAKGTEGKTVSQSGKPGTSTQQAKAKATDKDALKQVASQSKNADDGGKPNIGEGAKPKI